MLRVKISLLIFPGFLISLFYILLVLFDRHFYSSVGWGSTLEHLIWISLVGVLFAVVVALTTVMTVCRMGNRSPVVVDSPCARNRRAR